MTFRLLCLFVLAMLHAVAVAQPCAPKTWATPSATGSPPVQFANADGAALSWWCPAQPPAGASGTWWSEAGFWGLYAYGWNNTSAAIGRIVTARDPWAQYQIERDAGAKTPDSADDCAYKRLKYGACVALRTTSLGPAYPAAVTADVASVQCGPAPVCGVPSVVWRTPSSSSSGTLPIYAVVNGKRANTPLPGRSAPFSALCDCIAFRQDITAAGTVATYCALSGGPATECTLCKQVSQ